MLSKTYYDGAWYPTEEVRVPLSDRSVFFGDAVYEAMIGNHGICYRESDHLHRLFGNLRAMDIRYYDAENLDEVIRQAKDLSCGFPFFLYIQISRDSPTRKHAYPPRAKTHMLVQISPFSLPNPEKRLSLISVKDRRYDYCHVKTVNLLPNVFAAKEAENCGADEAVFVRGKTVTECSHSNIFLIKDGTLLTHPADSHILPGITRKRLLRLANEMHIPTSETAFTLCDLKKSDAVLVSATSKLAAKADVLDGKRLPSDDSVSERLITALFDDFQRETET